MQILSTVMCYNLQSMQFSHCFAQTVYLLTMASMLVNQSLVGRVPGVHLKMLLTSVECGVHVDTYGLEFSICGVTRNI